MSLFCISDNISVMFNIGLPELIIIFAIILIVLGPKRLPEFTRSVGRLIGNLKRSADDIKTELTREIINVKEEAEEIKEKIEKNNNNEGKKKPG